MQLDPDDLLESLIEKLGAKVTAFMVGRDVSTLSRWGSKGVPSNDDALRPLLVAFQIVNMLETVEAAPTIRAWFIGMNPQLDDESPAEAVREGRHREVMAAARAFMTGG
ncbi:hypothetical protein JOE61_002526 [Nocardioides salarius]|uniref:XRE family transcriptional regulator n=1 Tax=Nocardioides salarius TaxID=374513 RepID=A0ABS2MC69_9ACTN|nr:hypothetical protein [Nocardioides salarius]MBM7508712.1 hypothetical protein [Nocardioides salarius]